MNNGETMTRDKLEKVRGEIRERYRETFPAFADAIDTAVLHGAVYVNVEKRTRRGDHALVTLFTIGEPLTPVGDERERAEAAMENGAGYLNVSHDPGGRYGRLRVFWPDAAGVRDEPARPEMATALLWSTHRRCFYLRTPAGTSTTEALADFRKRIAGRINPRFSGVRIYGLNFAD